MSRSDSTKIFKQKWKRKDLMETARKCEEEVRKNISLEKENIARGV